MQSTPRVLVDTSAFRRTKVADAGVFPETVQLGSHEMTIGVIGVRRRPLPGAEHEWLRQQIEAMPTFARLAQEKTLSLCMYSELEIEEMAGSIYGSGVAGELLAGIEWIHLPAAVERSKFQQIDLSIYAKKKTMVKFCQFLLRMNQAALESQVDSWPFLSDFERSNLRNLGRFREICDALPETHYPDAFHLWTAEVNNLDYFLVVDKRFLNAITKTSRISPRTKLMAPRDLIQDLGIMSLDALS